MIGRRRRADVVEEEEEIAEGNNDAQQDQKSVRQRLMEDLAQNQQVVAAP